jgi:hypothetical protein
MPWFTASKRPAAARARKPRRPFLETLEDRLAPVVGAFLVPDAIAPGAGFDGVVKVLHGDVFGTGSLLSTGRHILTAAHVVDEGAATSVVFELPEGNIEVPVSSVFLHADWNGDTHDGNDLAILTLSALAPSGPAGTGAERFDIFRGSDEVNQAFTFVGYGRTGTGVTGRGGSDTGGVKRLGQNVWSADSSILRGGPMSIDTPDPGLALAYDFDSGQTAFDAFGRGYGIRGLGLGDDEAMQSNGDSGGPAFIDEQISGIVSFSRQRYQGFTEHDLATFFSTGELLPDGPDFDDEGNNSFGEFAVMTRVSAFADLIDERIGGSHILTLDMRFQQPGDDGLADVILVRRNGANIEVRVNGQLYHSESASNITRVEVFGSDDEDRITIEGDLGVNVFVDGRLDTDRLTVVGTGNGDTMTVSAGDVRVGPRVVTYTRIQELAVNGAGGSDTINVQGVAAGATLSVAGGAENDTISLQTTALLAGLTVNGGTGVDTLVAANRDNAWSISSVNAGTLNGRAFSSIENLTGGTLGDTFAFGPQGLLTGSVNGGSGLDTLDYSGRSQGVSVTLNTGTATLSATAIGGTASSIEAMGGSAFFDTLTGPNAVNTWSVESFDGGSLSNTVNVSSFRFRGVEILAGGTAADTFRIAPAGLIRGGIDGGAGVDRLDYSDYPSGVSVDLLAGAATALGGVRAIENVTGSRFDDLLRGDDNANALAGVAGNDVVVGLGGSDSLSAGLGRSILIGGDGVDALVGGSGQDVLIGASTVYDRSDAALNDLRREWTRTDLGYEDRIKSLSNGVGSSLARLTASTVLDDGDYDKLTGSGDLDWFWALSPDILTDLLAGERVN